MSAVVKPSDTRPREGFPLPLTTRPMEAKLAGRLPEGRWQFEPKWDGFRRLAFKADDAVEFEGEVRQAARALFP